jgi:acyl dehydratase
VRSYQVRFTKPVYVPADEGATLTSVATVMKPLEAESGELTLSLSVKTEAGDTVLGKAQVVVAAR